MKNKLSGKTAVVTGGAKGYGAGIAAALREKGATVWVTGRDQSALDAASAKLEVLAVRADVTCSADWDRVLEEVLRTAGSLDILVNNAGAAIRIAALAEMSDDEIRQSIAVNLTGAALGCRRAARVMMEQRSGIIINVSSVCQREAWPGYAIYSAAKAGVGQLSSCLYTELREYGVRVTTLIPSWGATGFRKASGLPPRAPDEEAQCIQPSELGAVVASMCELPPHLEIQDVTIWPMIQEVAPL